MWSKSEEQKSKFKTCFELFLAFARIGVMTFGGGMAMLPILQRDIVETHRWVTEEELTDYYAIGQCTPGIIAINTATFVGNKRAGFFGGIFATLGMVFPSLVIITTLASVIAKYAHYPAVENAFAGIQAAVCVLIFSSVIKLAKGSVNDKVTAAIFIGVCVLNLLTDLSPVIFVVIASCVGICSRTMCEKHLSHTKKGKVQ